MSETAVRVDLRQANLSESARLHEADDRIFLALEQPPPVRSLLKLTIGEEQKAFEVGRVVEVASDDERARGCYGEFVALERLAEQAKVGSEHLQPGISGGGIPSPVAIMSTAEMMLGEAGGGEDEAAAAADASEPTPAEAAARDEQWEGSSTSDSAGADAAAEAASDDADSSDDAGSSDESGSSDDADSSDESGSSDESSSDDAPSERD